MSHFQLDARSYLEVTRERDPENTWDGEDTLTSWDINGVKLCDKNSYDVFTSQEDFSLGDEYHAVIAVWSTGDSFSRSDGAYCEIFGVYHSKEDADSRIDQLRSGKEEWLPWDGYFEHLDSLEVYSGVL